MKNSVAKSLYHTYLINHFGIRRFRGGWMLTQMFVNDWKRHGKAHPFSVAKIHLKGWSYSDWKFLGISNDTKDRYLSTVAYCSLHPFTGSESSWIDDKLTLKYILHGTTLSEIMPKYYFQIESRGKVLRLMDASDEFAESTDGIMRLLDETGRLAFKKIKASLGEGFYSVSKDGNGYVVNGQSFTSAKLKEFLGTLSGYLVLELLRPNAVFAKYTTSCPGCLRYIIGRKLDGSIVDIYCFMRIGTKKSGTVENFNSGGVLVIPNENGFFSGGYVLDASSLVTKHINTHPDNGYPLQGVIPKYNEVKSTAWKVAEQLPQLNYMGIDFVITDEDKVKILEINSLSSLDAIQLDKSILENKGGEFFKERLSK